MAKGKEENLEEKIIIDIKSEDILGDCIGDMNDIYVQKEREKLAKKFEGSFLNSFMIHKAGYKFCFHKNDDDKWPSYPHGHSVEKKYKINPFTGEIFDIKTKQQVDRIRRKHMESFWKELKEKGLDLAEYNPKYKEEYYKKHNT